MAEKSSISWTDSTFNPFIGCTKISPGCDHCYAEAFAKRTGRDFAVRTRTSAANWKKPIAWNAEQFVECGSCGWRGELREAPVAVAPGESMHRCLPCEKQALRAARRRVFCASLADVFDNQVPTEWRDDLWRLMEATPSLDWLLLTKRIGNVPHMVWPRWMQSGFPSNVWLGATVCNQEEANRDIPKLLYVPARVRFLSVEPMLGPVDLERGGWSFLRPLRPPAGSSTAWQRGVDWIILGGESGPKRRPMQIEWARALIAQCQSAGVPMFVKQDNGLHPGAQGRFSEEEWKTKEFPE